MEDSQQTNYHAYLLRLWRDDEETPWRAALENPHTGEQHRFSGMNQLLNFIQQFSQSDEDGIEKDLRGF